MKRILLAALLAISAFGQTAQPTPLLNAWIPGIRSTTVIDNRSIVNRQLTYVSIGCTGSGSWSASLQYASASTGSWNSYGSGSTVVNTSTVPVAFGFSFLYPNFIRVRIISGSPTCNFSGFNRLFPQSPSGTGGGVSSFNSRTGDVIPLINDYSFSLISGVATNAQTTATSANTANAIVARDGSGNFSAGTISAALNGNASTASALASNPTDCSVANTFANVIAANGNLTCDYEKLPSRTTTSTTDTILSTDLSKFITVNNTAGVLVTLPQATGSFADGFWFIIKNIAASGSVTIVPTTSTISGTTLISLDSGEWALVRSDGTNYEAISNRLVQGTNITLTKSRTGTNVASSGGGGSSNGAYCTVTFAAAQTIDLSATSGGVQCSIFAITLTANITSLTLSNASTARAHFEIWWIQNATGGWTVSSIPVTAIGWCTPQTTLSKMTIQPVGYDGTNYQGEACTDVNGTGTAAVTTSVQSGSYLYCLGATGNAAATCGLTPALTAYTSGQCFVFRNNFTNTTTYTVNIDGLGVKSILDPQGSALAAGAITTGIPTTICYNGTSFNQQFKPSSGGGGGGTRTINVPVGGVNGGASGLYPGWTLQANGTGFSVALVASVVGGPTMSNSGTPTMATSIWLPDDYASGLAIRIMIYDAGGAGGHLRFSYGTICWASAATPSGTMTNTANSADTTITTSSAQYILSTSIATVGCTAGSQMVLQIARDNSVGSNMASAVTIVGVEMTYTSSY